MNNISRRITEILTHGSIGSPYQEKFANPLSNEELNSIENELNCRLPLDYREFLKEFGREDMSFACHFDYNRNVELKRGTIGLVYGFFESKDSDRYESNRDIIQVNLNFESEKPNDVLCIGDDPGGYQICLSVQEGTFGKIYFWDRGEAWEFESLNELDFIANSFGEFVHKLRIVN